MTERRIGVGGAGTFVLREFRRRFKNEEPGLTKAALVDLSGLSLSEVDEAVEILESKGRIVANGDLYRLNKIQR